jgi:hypothetical protein
MQFSVLAFQEELQRFLGEVAGELCAVENIQLVNEYTIGTVPSPMTKGRPEPTPNISAHHLVDLTSGASSHPYAQLPSSSQVQPIPHDNSFSGLRAPFVFSKLPNPMHKMFESLSVTDGPHLGNLIKIF